MIDTVALMVVIVVYVLTVSVGIDTIYQRIKTNREAVFSLVVTISGTALVSISLTLLYTSSTTTQAVCRLITK
jgi:hypothetical protein